MAVRILDQPIVVIGDLHAEVHEGNLFTVTLSKESIANNGTLLVRCKAGSKYLHFISSVETVGEWFFESFVGTTYTDEGTEVTIFPRKSDSEVIFNTDVYEAPTIDVLGGQRFTYYFGSGSNPSRVSSASNSDDIESVFAPEEDLLIRLTNLSGSAQYVTLLFNMYEEDIE